MGKQQVKFFNGNYASVEDSINKWINENDVVVEDIKFTDNKEKLNALVVYHDEKELDQSTNIIAYWLNNINSSLKDVSNTISEIDY